MSHQPNKKSLRRKPPPIDDSTPFSIYQNLTSNPEQYSDFQVSLSKSPPIQVNTFVQSSPPNYIQLPPSAPPPPIPVQRPEYTLQVGSFPEAASAPVDQTNYNVSMSLEFPFDESFISMGGSPKPKGPKQIWEYEDDSIISQPIEYVRHASINSTDYKSRPRGYQQMSTTSQSAPLDSIPYPIEDLLPIQAKPTITTAPYPTQNFEDSIDNYYESDYDYTFEDDSPSQMQSVDKYGNGVSPRIDDVPDLTSKRSLLQLAQSVNTLWQSHSQTNLIQSGANLVGIQGQFPMSAPPFLESPPRPSLRQLATKNSQNFPPPNTQAIDYALDLSYSRSPSPTRRTIDRTKTVSLGFTYAESEFIEDFSEGYNEFAVQHGPSSRWNSVNSNATHTPENLFWDDGYQLPTESPATEYFDYSMLPELPSVKPLPKSPSYLPEVLALKQQQELPSLPLELPDLPFSSAFLQSQHFEICSKIWSLSELFKWCLKLRIWLNNLTISKTELKKALGGLLAFHRRDVPLDVVSNNAAAAFETFVLTGAIEVVEDVEAQGSDKTLIVMNENVYLNGVLPLLTECYSNFQHTKEVEQSNMTCYSTCCTLSKSMNLERKMRNTNIKDIVLEHDWTSHWHLTVEDLKTLNHATSKQQSLIFDLMRYEQTFIQRADCFVEVVAPEFIKAAKSYFGQNSEKLAKFEQDVISAGKQIVDIHRTVLFEPLLKFLIAEGKFIKNLVGIGQTYSDWAFEVKPPLIKYMSCMPMIEELLGIETIKAFIDNRISTLPRVRDLKVNVGILFISTFNSRYMQLPLQLEDIYKKFDVNDPEHISMLKAANDIRKLGVRINDSKKLADNNYAISVIKDQLLWKSGVTQINLNLNSPNRKFVCRGDLTRKSVLSKLQTANINHIILLDNYVLITDRSRNRRGGLAYKILEDPIPVEYLIVEEKVVSTSTLLSNQNSLGTIQLGTADAENDDSDAFQLKLRYAGRTKRAYTFSCGTEREIRDWVNYFIAAKSTLCKRLAHSNPYRVVLVSNTVFGYENSHRVTKLQLLARYDPIYDICQDSVEKTKKLNLWSDLYNPRLSRNRIVFSKLQCMCWFEYKGSKYNLVALEAGLYMCESKGRWKKIIGGDNYVQMQVDSEIGIVVVLTEKQLGYYPIHQILNVYNETKLNLTCIPLSKDTVLFFEMGRHKNVKMLFYAKKKTNGSIHFKVMIPQIDNGGIFSRFKDHARFYIEAECFGISIFNSSFAVHTDKGFEILTLDKLIPSSVPELPPPVETEKKKADPYATRKSKPTSLVETIRMLINAKYKPMGMYKLNNNKEFLLVYKEYAIFINKHGKPSRDFIIHFKAHHVYFENNYLFVVNDQLIEVWHIGDHPKKAQVIIGKDIKHLGQNGFSMANPLVPGLQLVFRLVE